MKRILAKYFQRDQKIVSPKILDLYFKEQRPYFSGPMFSYPLIKTSYLIQVFCELLTTLFRRYYFRFLPKLAYPREELDLILPQEQKP